MSQKGKVVRPFEYCLERSKLAIEDKLIPELRQEIIHGELSPDKVWREAMRRLKRLRIAKDLSSTDWELASSYWWLAKTKRDHRERFEKEIKSEGKEILLEDKKVLFTYCYKCRSRTVMKGPFRVEKISSTRDLPALRGFCENCGGKIHRTFAPKNEAERELPKEVSGEITIKKHCVKCGEVEIKLKRGENPLSVNCPKCQGEIRLRSGIGTGG